MLPETQLPQVMPPTAVAEINPTSAELKPDKFVLDIWKNKVEVVLTPPSDQDIHAEAVSSARDFCRGQSFDETFHTEKSIEYFRKTLADQIAAAKMFAIDTAEGLQMGAARTVGALDLYVKRVYWENKRLWAGKEPNPTVQVLQALSKAAGGNRDWRAPDFAVPYGFHDHILLFKTDLSLSDATGLVAFQKAGYKDENILPGEKAGLCVVVHLQPDQKGEMEISSVGFTPVATSTNHPNHVFLPLLSYLAPRPADTATTVYPTQTEECPHAVLSQLNTETITFLNQTFPKAI